MFGSKGRQYSMNAGNDLKNSVVFSWGFLELALWFWVRSLECIVIWYGTNGLASDFRNHSRRTPPKDSQVDREEESGAQRTLSADGEL